ncbi:MAG: sulfite exporter TauE/SafE family protein [Deltaproteobacteria bacterium]|nr:sulfite exporter TauE/SafE family protein [Deltaproteobacteria bacterium]
MSAGILAALVAGAFVTSILSAIVGMGGGLTLLGLMTALLPPTWVVPLHAVVQLFSNFTRTLVFLRQVSWKIFLIYLLPMIGGVALATSLWQPTKMGYLKPAIGLFILAFLAWRRFGAPRFGQRNLPLWTFAPVGLFVGFLTLFVGATGPFVAPFFLRDDLSKEEIVATKAACQSIGHALKIPAFLTLGFDFQPHLGLVAAMVVAVILGTVLGKAILHRISRPFFLLLFESVLVVMALWLLLGAAFG